MDSEKLICSIREAFRDVTLEDGVSLNMTEYNDSSGMVDRFRQLAATDEREDWQKIEDKTLEQFIVTFSFTDWKGFRFYLPAYMIWTIRHPDSHCIIGEFTIYALDPDKISDLYRKTVDNILNRRQIEVVAHFLQYCIEVSEGDDVDAAMNLSKLKKYL